MSRVLVIVLLCLGACLPGLAMSRAGLTSSHVVADGSPSTPDCGCGGRCGMNACGCSATPAEPAPTHRDPAMPGAREGKGLVLGLFEPLQPIRLATGGASPGRRPLGEHAPIFSYDSILCFVCVWRS